MVHTPPSLSICHPRLCRYVAVASLYRLQHYVVVFICKSSWQRIDVVIEWMKGNNCLYSRIDASFDQKEVDKYIEVFYIFWWGKYTFAKVWVPLWWWLMEERNDKKGIFFYFFCMAKHILNEYKILQCIFYRLGFFETIFFLLTLV